MSPIDSMQFRGSRVLLNVAISTLLLSCGGGGGTTTAGIDRGGIVNGPLTGFGSVFVNGERYEIDNAVIEVNGQPATQADLAVGQVVFLNSVVTNNSRSADSVSYESNLRGPVTSIDTAAGTLVALGQGVIIDAGTSFGAGITPADIFGLQVGDIVEISGLVNAAGNVRATRVELESEPYQIQLSGSVRQSSGLEFRIGSQVVDYSSATLTDFPGGDIRDGDQVRVLGDSFGVAGEILATELAYRGAQVLVEAGDEGEIEGLIAGFVSSARFNIAGFAVRTTSQTEFSGGTAADLGNDIRIEVEGEFNTSGVLVADSIEFREEGEARIEAVLDAVNVSAKTVTVFGVEVSVTPLTKIEDKIDEANEPFDFGRLVPGDYLKIIGTWDGDRVVATLFERVGPEDKNKLRGPVSDVGTASFTLLGKVIETAAGSTEFEADDGSVSASEFYVALNSCVAAAEACIAEAEYKEEGSGVIADAVELED